LEKGKVVVLEERVPKLKELRRQKVNRRLIGYIAFFFILILCILYLQSPLSNIKHIEVRGNIQIPDKDIIQLSGLSKKDSFWEIKTDGLVKKISSHPEIKTARAERQFPNKVIVTVEERKRVAYIYHNEKFLPILENGRILKRIKQKEIPSDAPILVGWERGDDIQEMTAQLTELAPGVASAISEIHHTPTPTNRYHVTVYMNDGFEVSASVHNFAEKMALYPSIVSQLDPGVKGVIHLEVSNYFKAYKTGEKNEEGNGNEKDTR